MGSRVKKIALTHGDSVIRTRHESSAILQTHSKTFPVRSLAFQQPMFIMAFQSGRNFTFLVKLPAAAPSRLCLNRPQNFTYVGTAFELPASLKPVGHALRPLPPCRTSSPTEPLPADLCPFLLFCVSFFFILFHTSPLGCDVACPRESSGENVPHCRSGDVS